MRLGGIAITLTGVLALGACSAMAADDEPLTATVAVAVPGGKNATGTNADVVEAVEAAFTSVAPDVDDTWQINVQPVTDSQVPDADDLVAVIGGLREASILKLAPALTASSVLFVSPADGDRLHTRGADPMKPVRPYESYFTVAVEDADPLEVLADYGVHGRGLTEFAAIDSGDPQPISDFKRAANALNADVPVSGAKLPANDLRKDDERVDGVFVSGDAHAAADVAEAASDFDLPILVDPDVDLEAFIDAGGQSVNGAVSVTPSKLTDHTNAQPTATNGLPDTSPLGAAAYDAAVAVATTLGRCLPPADSALDAREGCLGEMREVVFAGSTGEISFNKFGERVGAFAEVVVARDGKWRPVAS